MLGEVVADEHVEQVRVAAQVSVRKSDQLSVTGRGRVLGRPGEELHPAGQDRGGDQEGRRGRVFGEREHLGRRVGVVADQAAEEVGVGVGHVCSVHLGADGPLTTPRGPRAPGGRAVASKGAHSRRSRRSRGSQGW
jgi:hypothetical protein